MESAPGLKITRLAAGDEVEVVYGMTLQKVKVAEGTAAKQSLRFGPWLLGAAASDNPDYFNELYAQNVFDFEDAHSTEAVGKSPFNVPRAAMNVRFAPAEYPEQPALAKLSAVATQTGSKPELWQLVFASQPHTDKTA